MSQHNLCYLDLAAVLLLLMMHASTTSSPTRTIPTTAPPAAPAMAAVVTSDEDDSSDAVKGQRRCQYWLQNMDHEDSESHSWPSQVTPAMVGREVNSVTFMESRRQFDILSSAPLHLMLVASAALGRFLENSSETTVKDIYTWSHTCICLASFPG